MASASLRIRLCCGTILVLAVAAPPMGADDRGAGSGSLPGGQAFTCEVVDVDTGSPLPARVYLRDKSGDWRFVGSPGGSAVRYEKRNWIRTDSVEVHTTVSAGPFGTTLPDGEYQLVVERGKEYSPAAETFMVAGAPVALKIPLKRWINLAERGWFSGDTHVHRTLDELPNVMLAEDLNVAFPLTYWVTNAFQAPRSGDKNQEGQIPPDLVTIDDSHVIWPRNTEWEIFSVGGERHTLGAVFALGHQQPFERGVPPVRAVAAEARRQGALLDLDKHDWPWSMTLPPTMGVELYELANNHLWRTGFAFENWSSPTPDWLRPPLAEQSGNEREWIHFTFANYYALLNCGIPMVPTAGTASGVHPVPLGFGRVYVHLADGFDYARWVEGLKAGRSFVTTGPMLFATANGELPGATLIGDEAGLEAALAGEILSEHPLAFAEVVHDGRAVRTIMGGGERAASGAFRTPIAAEVPLDASGWLALRCWEDRPDGRPRYAHSAPWHVHFPGRPLVPRRAERDYLVARVEREIARSKGVLPEAALDEYETALNYYRSLPIREPEDTSQLRPAGPGAPRQRWLEIMRAHSFRPAEVEGVLGLPPAQLATGPDRMGPAPKTAGSGAVTVLPYPGGRHPRIGFLDGALAPQRDTKVSVFTPWDPRSYVVVDLPEAIWTNLGLTYLAHTHIPTLWDQRGEKLPPLEWERLPDGALAHERTLPNGIAFGARVVPAPGSVRMELWIKNGSGAELTDIRIQNCVMLKAAEGFSDQSNANKRLHPPLAAARSEDGRRWILTAWQNCGRAWANPPVPCLHSDPTFPDLAPGQKASLHGGLWFYEGDEPDAEIARIQRAVASLPDASCD